MQNNQPNKYAEFLFTDLALAEKIKQNGFAVVDLPSASALNNAIIDAKKLLKIIPFWQRAFKFTSVGRILSNEARIASTQSINKYIVPHLSGFFDTEKVAFISGVHLIKPPSPLSNLNPHQDSSLVDEQQFPTVYAWVPLTNVGPKNGTLYVLPKSHNAGLFQRSLNIPWEFLPYIDVLKKYMVPINVKLGQAIIFDSALIHSSSRNVSMSVRIAVNVFIKPLQANYLHYYSNKELNYEQTEVYNVSPDFYYNDNIMERPGKPYTIVKKENIIKLGLTKKIVNAMCEKWLEEYYLDIK